MDPHTGMPVLVLKDFSGRASVPLWVGLVEASAIVAEFEKVEFTRPMTHDLMREVVTALGGEVRRVEITDIREHTFYAKIVIQQGTRAVEVDARPSDAIALALRVGRPIFVTRKVIEKSRRVDMSAPLLAEDLADVSAEEGRYLLESLSDDAFGKWTM